LCTKKIINRIVFCDIETFDFAVIAIVDTQSGISILIFIVRSRCHSTTTATGMSADILIKMTVSHNPAKTIQIPTYFFFRKQQASNDNNNNNNNDVIIVILNATKIG